MTHVKGGYRDASLGTMETDDAKSRQKGHEKGAERGKLTLRTAKPAFLHWKEKQIKNMKQKQRKDKEGRLVTRTQRMGERDNLRWWPLDSQSQPWEENKQI